MDIDIIKKNQSLDGNRIVFINVNRREAIGLIKSLANQLDSNDPNCGRMETLADADKESIWVTISVNPTKKSKPKTIKKYRKAKKTKVLVTPTVVQKKSRKLCVKNKRCSKVPVMNFRPVHGEFSCKISF